MKCDGEHTLDRITEITDARNRRVRAEFDLRQLEIEAQLDFLQRSHSRRFPAVSPYQFPPTIFTRNSLARQWLHLLSEVIEVGVALLRGNFTHAAQETFDVRQSSETLTRILEKRGVDVAGMKDEVVAGCAERGYYQ